MRSSSSQPVSPTRRCWRYRPELIALEARLVPGESVFGAALSAAWLTAATPAATVRSAERSAPATTIALLDEDWGSALPAISAAVTGPASETIALPAIAGTVRHDGLDLPDMTSTLQHAALGAGASFASQGALPLTGGGLQTAPDIGSFAARGSLFAGHADAESHLELLAAGLRGTATTATASVPTTAVTPQRAAAVHQQLAQLPLSFEANQGQADPSVRFLSHNQGYSLYLTATEAVVVLSQPVPAAASALARQTLYVRNGWRLPRRPLRRKAGWCALDWMVAIRMPKFEALIHYPAKSITSWATITRNGPRTLRPMAR